MAQTLSNLPVGAKIKYGKHQVNTETPWSIVWTVVAKNHKSTPAYPANAVTLHTTKIVDMRCFDAAEPQNVRENRREDGNNRYKISNMHQWLNSRAGAGSWYTGLHSTDQSPNSSSVVLHGTQHANRPGFLNLFTDNEYNAILDTTIRTAQPEVDGAAYDDIVAKLFLASRTEIGLGEENGYSEGAKWGYYTDDASRKATLTQQVFDNTLSTLNMAGATVDTYREWWLRTPDYQYDYAVRRVYSAGNVGYTQTPANIGSGGVRPAMNLPATMLVSDSTDADDCYTVVWNATPTIPPSIDVPTTIYGGKSASISWGSSSDSDGNLSGYVLERSYDGGSFEQIYKGSARSFNDSVAYGKGTVQYRVYAYDSHDAASGYATSATRTIINNKAPTISGTDQNLGAKTDGFTQSYVVSDENGDIVTVTEAIDGVEVRTYIATLGATQNFAVIGETWLKVGNGSHAMTITATDSAGDSTVRTYTFSRSVDSFTIQNSTPYESSAKPTRIKLYVTRNIPGDADFKVYVCNNGFDASPTWEDATNSVLGNAVHVFNNEAKTAGSWGVIVKVVVSRNGASGACYVSQIGGNFE